MNNVCIAKKVSVIIPTYNRAEFLPNAVKSIIEQGHENIEIIIVDDGSNDDTPAVVATLKNEHPNIIYCHNERLKGPSGARNTGILKASGDYLSFLDSDDVWMEGHLKSGVVFLEEHPEIDVLFGNAKIVDISSSEQFNFFDNQKIFHTLDSVEVMSGFKILNGNLFEVLIQASFFLFGSAIIKRSISKGILLDEFIMYSEDRDFAIRLYKEAGARFVFREDPVVIQYRHDSNICNSAREGDNLLRIRLKMLEAQIYIFTKYLRTYDLSNDEKRLLNRIISNKLSTLSFGCWIVKEYKRFVLYMIQSFKYCLTSNQFRNLLKVLIYPLIRSRYNSYKLCSEIMSSR